MKNKLDWKNYRMTLSDYIDHIEEKWLNAWISTWRLNKTKIHINEMDISRLVIDFRDHRYWALASDLNYGTIKPVMIKPVSESTMDEIKAQYDINLKVDFIKYSHRQEAYKNINKDFE